MRRLRRYAEQKSEAPLPSRSNLAINMQVSRTLLGWSQDQLGESCGLKRTYIGAVERQEINPGIDNVDRIGVGLGISAHILIRAPEDAQPLIYKILRRR